MSGKKFLILVAAAMGSVLLCRADEDMIRKMSVSAEMSVAPDVNYRSHSVFSPKNPSVSKWLMVKIDYVPDLQKNFIPAYRRRQGSTGIFFPGWLDDVTLNVKVVFETGVNYNGKPIRGVFTGSTELWSVKRDGKTHLALFFVPARLLDRYCVPGAGGRTVNKSSFHIRAEMSYKGGVLARAYSNVIGASPEEKERNFVNMENSVPQNLKFINAVLPRSRSPWALLAPDNFDLEKEGVTQK